MIKKNILLSVMMLFALAACGNGSTTQQQTTETKKIEKQKVILPDMTKVIANLHKKSDFFISLATKINRQP